MKIYTFILLLLCFFTPAFSQDRFERQVKESLEKQIKAWNSGRLEDAMGYYQNSPDLLWISKAGIERGYQPILNSYLQDFDDRSKMGEFTYTPLAIEAISKKVVYFVYRWKIELNGKKIMGGVSSQLWKHNKGRWLIYSEHAS